MEKKRFGGDMPGDVIKIEQTHRDRVALIFPGAMEYFLNNGGQKFVFSVFGGSGVGKSEIGALLAESFQDRGIKSYVMSGDNYPYRIPKENDLEREKRYREGGRKALVDYLGTEEEIDFPLVNDIIRRFKSGESTIPLKRMGRTPLDIYFEQVDFSEIPVLIIEWTHGKSEFLTEPDFSVFLYSTPEETLKHRSSRGRDKGTDSPFTTMVLEIEQEKLNHQGESASMIVSLSGEIINVHDYKRRKLR